LKLRQRFQKKYASRDPIQAYIKRGKKLFFGSLPIEKKSSKNCVSCHTPGEVAQVNKLYPRYVPLASRIMSLEQMQNYCIKNHLAGKPFQPGGKDSLSISAYINHIIPK
jgi:cytochrome c